MVHCNLRLPNSPLQQQRFHQRGHYRGGYSRGYVPRGAFVMAPGSAPPPVLGALPLRNGVPLAPGMGAIQAAMPLPQMQPVLVPASAATTAGTAVPGVVAASKPYVLVPGRGQVPIALAAGMAGGGLIPGPGRAAISAVGAAPAQFIAAQRPVMPLTIPMPGRGAVAAIPPARTVAGVAVAQPPKAKVFINPKFRSDPAAVAAALAEQQKQLQQTAQRSTAAHAAEGGDADSHRRRVVVGSSAPSKDPHRAKDGESTSTSRASVHSRLSRPSRSDDSDRHSRSGRR